MDNSDDPGASLSSKFEALLKVSAIAYKQDYGTDEEETTDEEEEEEEERDARIFGNLVPRKKRSHRKHHQSSSSSTNTKTSKTPWMRLIEDVRPNLQNTNAESKPSSCVSVTQSGLQSLEYKPKKLRKIPEKVRREEKLESINVDHTELPQTAPEKSQTVDRVDVESSSRPLSDMDEEYGTDDNRGLQLLSSVAVLVGEYEAKEDKSKQEEAYSGPTNKKEDKYKERVLSLWVNKFEQRSITSVEPVLQNSNLDSESSPSSSVSQSKKSRPINAEERRSRKKGKIVDGLEVEPTQTTPPQWLLNVMIREENSNNPLLISTLCKSDLDKIHKGLLIPTDQVQNPDFLTEEETRTIDKKGMNVDFVGPPMNKHVGILREWKITENCYYIFAERWKDVVAVNSFKVDDVFHLWSFRYGRGKLCFALVPPTTTNPSHDSGSTSGESGHGNTLPNDSSECSHGCSSLGDDSPCI